MSKELSKPITKRQQMEYIWKATREKLDEYGRTFYTEPYNEDQRRELAAHIDHLDLAVREYIERHGEEPA